jgi:8-oxo-dGTP pyrophosphatase MutT (NUDIX family)
VRTHPLALRIRLERLGFRAAHGALRVWWFVRRPHVHGVKGVLRPAGSGAAAGSGEVLFIRHTYGDRAEWQLPGGGLGRREDPVTAMRREAREELGLDLQDLRSLGSVEAAGQHKTVTLHCFEARVDPAALEVRWAEIEDVRWAPGARPPQPLGESVAETLALA